MTPERTDRLIWFYLAVPFILFGALALGFWIMYQRDMTRTPPPLSSGPFHLSAWLLPQQYGNMQLVQLVDGEGVGLSVSQTLRSRGYGYWGFDTLLRLEPDAHGALQTTQSHHQSQPSQVMMLTRGGSILSMNDTFAAYGSGLPQRPNLQAVLRPLADATHGEQGQFDIGFYSAQSYWFTMLDSQRVGMIDDHAALGGTARPWISHVGSPPVGGKQFDHVAACGDVWQGWPSLGIMVEPGQLYLLDRTSEQFVLRPEFTTLCTSALAATPQISRFAFSGGCLITQSRQHDKLRLFGADGSRLEIRCFDPQTQNPDGTARPVPPAGILSLLPLRGSGRFESAARALRSEGRRTRLDACADTAYDSQILPSGDGRFVLLDDTYQRLTEIEYRPH